MYIYLHIYFCLNYYTGNNCLNRFVTVCHSQCFRIDYSPILLENAEIMFREKRELVEIHRWNIIMCFNHIWWRDLLWDYRLYFNLIWNIILWHEVCISNWQPFIFNLGLLQYLFRITYQSRSIWVSIISYYLWCKFPSPFLVPLLRVYCVFIPFCFSLFIVSSHSHLLLIHNYKLL